MLGAGENGLTPSGIANALRPLLRVGASPLRAACVRFEQLGLADKVVPRPRSVRWQINPSGREAAARLLGGAPAHGRNWLIRAARKRGVVHLLGLDERSAAAAAANADTLAACLRAKRRGWTFEPGTTLQNLARDAAAQDLQAANARPASLWKGLLERVLSADAPVRTGSEPLAAQIARAARTAPDEAWFGPGKFFIHRAWEAWRHATGDSGTDLAAFKARLLAALRAGELGLTRADFPDAIAPAELAAAETRYGAETFHFITAENPKIP